MRRAARIAALTAVLAGTGWLAGLGGPAGAQNSAPTTSYGIECGSDQTVTIITDAYLVPGKRRGEAPNSRQALAQSLRESGVSIRPSEFRRAGGGDGPGLHSYSRDGERRASAYVEPIGDTYHVPNIVVCDKLANGS